MEIGGQVVLGDRAILAGEVITVRGDGGAVQWTIRELSEAEAHALENETWSRINAGNAEGALRLKLAGGAPGYVRPMREGILFATGKSDEKALPAVEPDPARFRVSAGARPELRVSNANGSLILRSVRRRLSATIDGRVVPDSSIVRQGNVIRVLSAQGSTLFSAGVFLDGSLICSPALDPFSSIGRIGAAVRKAEPALGAQLGNGDALVAEAVLSGFAAERAGVEQFDVITLIDSLVPSSASDLDRALSSKRIGEDIALHILRRGRPMTIVVRLATEAERLNNDELGQKYSEVQRKLEKAARAFSVR